MKVSEASFDQLKKIGKGYYATFDKLHNIDDFEVHLNQFLSSGAYYHEAQVVDARQLVEKINGLKIEIYSNEHPPPHFHVVSNGNKASFAIDDCRELENSGFSQKSIQSWFLHSKNALIKIWNETRPSDCQVGAIK